MRASFLTRKTFFFNNMSNENTIENENNKFFNKRRKIVITGLIFSSALVYLAKQDLKPFLNNPETAKWYAILIISEQLKWSISIILYFAYSTIHDISFEKIKALIGLRSKK